jgi:hypothetical protein
MRQALTAALFFAFGWGLGAMSGDSFLREAIVTAYNYGFEQGAQSVIIDALDREATL